jgi:serine/threonine-protein kinase
VESVVATRLVCPACNTRYEGGTFCAKDGTALVKDTNAPVQKNRVGSVIADRYRIVRLLGEGGMGQVYEAAHVNINKRFAIKLLRPEIVANPEAVARFRQEAWSASSIGHVNIVGIDDFANLPDGSVYLAMEFLQGRSLSERMKAEPPLEAGEALDIFVQVCSGLAAAHEKGIVHRDMKPENIFLVEKPGRLPAVKILDFGIAKVSGSDGATSLTRTGAIFGTPFYMSPEQALGKSIDFRSDLYSVGVIMYEVFTGRVPFEAESFMGILTKHVTSQPLPPTEIAPERQIAPEIEAAILRCMAKEPADRFASMDELGSHLGSIGLAYGLTLSSHTPPLGIQRVGTQARMDATGRPISQQFVRTPSGLRAQPVAPPGAIASAPMDAVAPSPSEIADLRPRSRGVGRLIAVLAVVGLLVGGAAFVLTRPAPTPPPPAPAPVAAPVPAPAPVAAPVPVPVPAPAPAPAPAVEVEVIVDTMPPGAKILRDGKAIAETPEAVKVAPHDTVRVVLHKEGFIDEAIVVDPEKGHKLVVKLDPVRRGGKATKHTRNLPVYSTPAPAAPPPKATAASSPPLTLPPAPSVIVPSRAEPIPPPVVIGGARPPAPPSKTSTRRAPDPYERVDDSSKKSSDVLNPY